MPTVPQHRGARLRAVCGGVARIRLMHLHLRYEDTVDGTLSSAYSTPPSLCNGTLLSNLVDDPTLLVVTAMLTRF